MNKYYTEACYPYNIKKLKEYKEIEKQENQEIEVSEGSDSRSGSDNE